VGIDGFVLAFTAAASLTCGLFFGLVPALTTAGATLTGALKEGGRTGSAARGNRTRATFVVVEVALALVLLVGAGLLIRSFGRLLEVDPGFQRGHTITMRVTVPGSRYPQPANREQFFDRVLERISALPGVDAAGAISFIPLAGLGSATGYSVIGEPPPAPGHEPVTDVRIIKHDYFRAMGIPLLRGRLFTAGDWKSTNRVIINEAMARRHWPNDDPIGKRIVVSWDEPAVEDIVVGVVGDVRHQGLDADPRSAIYWPYVRVAYGGLTFAVRTAGDPRAVVPTVGAIVREADPLLAVADVRTIDDILDRSVAQRRLTMLLLTIFAAAALLLAAVGIYGVIAYSVTQRTQEIGIRLALGAPRRKVLAMVVRQAAALAVTGVIIGAAGAAALTRFMTDLLFQIEPFDPVTFAAVAAALTAVALLAAFVPGRRAAAVDPVVALRAE
jgi:putative ABC transport system permease protein